MQFVEAFNSLGYEVPVWRQDWSAEKPDGICLSLWSKETDWKALVMDTRIHATAIEDWGHKPGNRKRALHARHALDEFDGWIDVVKIDGTPLRNVWNGFAVDAFGAQGLSMADHVS
ncbi:MAG: hypothetical protein JF595_04825 [Sphingomonadales bacterium]|nr:hypothetical protein [Sphingomonadales bacterium]